MNSAPHLLNEDREEFRRILDEALRTAEYRPDLAATGMRLNTEQLRTMALSATTAIAACATAEYQHYVALREKLRAPAARPAAESESSEGPAEGPGVGVGFATAMGEVTEATGAGLAAMVTVLAPVLAGIAAVLFLVIGYVLHTVSTDEALSQPLISAGWVFAGLTAATFLVAMGSLVVAALRNGSTSLRASHNSELAQQVERAKEEWRRALLERGLLPFLREALATPPGSGERGDAGRDDTGGGDTGPGRNGGRRGRDGDASTFVPHHGTGSPDGGHAGSRMPSLGYSHPHFSSPADDRPNTRPRFTSPDFTSPDYGGPDHVPE